MPLQFVAQGPMLIPAVGGGPTPALWLDATVGVTSSSNLVSAWLDTQSGNSWNFVQGTGINQPHSGISTQNGLNLIDFTFASTEEFLTCTTFALAQPFTIFIVYATLSSAPRYIFDSVTGSNRIIALSTGANTNALTINAGGTNLDGVTNQGTGFVCDAIIYDGSGAATSKIYSNATLDATSAATIGTNNFVSGDGMKIGDRNANSSQQYVGQIGEIRIYPGVVSGANISSITAALRLKWGF